MKRKLLSIFLAAVMVLGTVSLSSCGKDKSVELSGGENGKSAYDLAVENGYKGTVQEWLASLAGENGKVGEKGERGESAYELAVKNGYTGTEIQWLASLAGEAGVAGKNGANGKSAYELAVEKGYTGTEAQWLASLIGPKGDTGAAGAKGDKGDTGAAGDKGDKGDKGDTGAAGSNGKSAYELACENGYTGTLAAWLDSLVGQQGTQGEKGEKGDKGDKGDTGLQGEKGDKGDAGMNGANGVDGKSAYELACENGFEGTIAQWLASLVGEKGEMGAAGTNGVDGINGADGKSAYELAVEKGYVGDVQTWLSSLVGEKGAKGDKGDAGNDGKNGKSAYELAVDSGYTGTVEEWLDSLSHGSKGDKGDAGKTAYEIAVENGFVGSIADWLDSLIGATGAQGLQGEKGETGAAGANGMDGKSAYDLAKDTGYTGSLTEWLASLIGAKGDQGIKGDQGVKGDKGDKGDKGQRGDAGVNGVDGKSAYELAVENGETRSLQDWLQSLVGKDAYGVAVANGYSGTVEQWLLSLKGADGVSITSVALDANGHLLVFLSDRVTALDVGKVVGEKGETGAKGADGSDGTNGADGVSIVGASIQDGSLYLLLSSGNQIYAGVLPKGDKGDKGDTGVGIADAAINANGHLILTLTDGTTKDAGKVTGGSTASTTFTVTFKDWDGTVLKTESVVSGGSATAPASPARAGYTFAGWDKAFDCITGNTVITATYTASTTPALEVSSKTASAGANKVAIAVSLKNNPGFLTMALKIDYDSSALTLTKASNGSDFSDYNLTAPKNKVSGCKAAWFATDLPEEILDGDILLLQFTVLADAQNGSYPITISCPSDGSTVDGSKTEFAISSATGYITVN